LLFGHPHGLSGTQPDLAMRSSDQDGAPGVPRLGWRTCTPESNQCRWVRPFSADHLTCVLSRGGKNRLLSDADKLD
jgi:hypothetical protein